MTVATQNNLGSFAAEFQRLRRAAGPQPTAWLSDLRDRAFERFGVLGLPTTDHEEWRFTNIEPIAATSFALPARSKLALRPQDLTPFTFGDLAGPLLVFVDGHYAPGLSRTDGLPQGVRVGNLADVIQSDSAFVQQHLARYLSFDDDAFTALNTAFVSDGGFVHVPRGKVVPQPIHLLSLATRTDSPVMTHPRNLIVVEAQSQATVIESYGAIGGALGEGVYLSNAVTEIHAGQDAIVHHYLVERESPAAFNISTLQLHQERGSQATSHTVLLGGALVRNNVRTAMVGPGCDCLINGLYVAGGTQHMDNHMRVEHVGDHCSSRQFYKGILDGRSRGVFSGRIVVKPGAQKTDAKQTNNNLLLSDQAQADTKPQLEIFADDVKCTHGATIGRMSEEALFYLQARGLNQDVARGLLIFAFASESLSRMDLPGVRQELERELLRRLPQGKLLADLHLLEALAQESPLPPDTPDTPGAGA